MNKFKLGKIILFCVLPLIASVVLLISSVEAQTRVNPERYYQERWCSDKGGQTEITLEDRTRLDCLTYAHAIEFDFADKWAEALGQALHYGRVTGMPPGVVLIVENPDDMRYVERFNMAVSHYGLTIEMWVVKLNDA